MMEMSGLAKCKEKLDISNTTMSDLLRLNITNSIFFFSIEIIAFHHLSLLNNIHILPNYKRKMLGLERE